jgi:hypothetical protein
MRSVEGERKTDCWFLATTQRWRAMDLNSISEHTRIIAPPQRLRSATSWPAVARPLAAESAMAWLNDAAPMGLAQTMKTFFCTPGRPAPRTVASPPASMRQGRAKTQRAPLHAHCIARGKSRRTTIRTSIRRRRDQRREPVGAPPHQVAERLERLLERHRGLQLGYI